MKVTLISLIFLYVGVITETQTHEVYEEINEYNSSENVRKVRQPQDQFKPTMYAPPIYVYQKTAQPDLRKWRYYQQQIVDSVTVGKIREQLRKHRAIQEKASIDRRSSETPVMKIPIQHRWKVIHPKFVIEKNFKSFPVKDVPSEFINPSTKKIEKINHTSRKRNPQSYKVQEDDLDVGASDIVERKQQIDRHDVANNILAAPNSIYIDQKGLVENKNFNAINSLLGNTQNAQLQGLKQFLHSQKANVAQFNVNDHIPITEHVVDSNNKQSHPNINVAQSAVTQQFLNGQQILQNHILPQQASLQPNSLKQLQAQLDAVAQKQAQEAIAEAQKEAFDHINVQHQAIEFAKIQAEKVALEQIQAHNLALGHLQNPQRDALIIKDVQNDNPNPINFKPHTEALIQLQPIGAQALNTQVKAVEAINAENVRNQAQQQAQAYIQLAATQPIGINSYTPSYLETVDQATKAQEEAAKHIKSLNAIAHAQRQAQAYKKSAAEAYSQPSSDIPIYSNIAQHDGLQEVYEGEHEEEYASKYSFGYRINDYESGNDFSHEQSNEGKLTKGRYHVLLPDGRVQNVEYWADPTGYHAKVTYSSVAHH